MLHVYLYICYARFPFLWTFRPCYCIKRHWNLWNFAPNDDKIIGGTQHKEAYNLKGAYREISQISSFCLQKL